MSGMQRARRAGLIKFALLTGAADSATAGITCTAGDGTAITTSDQLIGVMELAQTTNAWSDKTANSSITSGGKVLVPESANDKVAVWWMACDAGLQVASPFIAAGVGAGALANTDITITGIETTDTIICAVEIDATSGAWTDRTAATSITATNTVQCTASTAGNSLFVMYMDKSGPRGFSSINLQFGIATVDASPSSEPSTATLTGINDEDKLLVALCADETDYDALDELSSYITVSADNTLTITSQPSPTSTVGAKLLCFYQKTNDLAA